MSVEILLGCVGFISGVWKFSWVWKIFVGNFLYFFLFFFLLFFFFVSCMEIYCFGMEFFFFCVRHVLESLLNELMEMKNLGLIGILVGWH